MGILFGSDGPWLHPGVELHKIRLLGLPKAQEALITGENLLVDASLDAIHEMPHAEEPWQYPPPCCREIERVGGCSSK